MLCIVYILISFKFFNIISFISMNDFRYLLLDRTKRRHKKEGLNSVAYKLVNITKRKLFTHILADVNPYNFII